MVSVNLLPCEILIMIMEFLFGNQEDVYNYREVHSVMLTSKTFRDAAIAVFNPNLCQGSPLRKACRSGFLDSVRFLLSLKGIEVNIWEDYPLVAACYFGHTSVVELLLTQNVDANAVGYFSPLTIERNNDEQMMELILISGGIAHSKVTTRTILSIACMQGHFAIVKSLLKQPGIETTTGKNEPLLLALTHGHLKIVDLLLACKDVRYSVRNIWSLNVARSEYVCAFIDLLFAHKIYSTGFDATILYNHLARYECPDVLVHLIMYYDIPVDACDNIALHCSVRCNSSENIQILLHSTSVNITTLYTPPTNTNRTSNRVLSPMEMVGRTGEIETMKALLTYDSLDPTIRNNSVIKAAISGGNTEMLMFLLKDQRVSSSINMAHLIQLACKYKSYYSIAILLGIDIFANPDFVITPEILRNSGYAQIVYDVYPQIFLSSKHTKRLKKIHNKRNKKQKINQ